MAAMRGNRRRLLRRLRLLFKCRCCCKNRSDGDTGARAWNGGIWRVCSVAGRLDAGEGRFGRGVADRAAAEAVVCSVCAACGIAFDGAGETAAGGGWGIAGSSACRVCAVVVGVAVLE